MSTDPTTGTAGTGVTTATTGPEHDGPLGPRMVTIVFGLVLLVIAGTATLTQITDLDVDPWAVGIGLMIGVGVLLLVGSGRRRT